MEGPGWACPPLPSPSLLPLPLADLLAREAQFVVTIGNVKGVLDTSILDPEPGPQGPFITYNYYVTYDFVEDEEGEASDYGGVLAEVCAPRAAPRNWGHALPLAPQGLLCRQNRFLGPRKPLYSELSGSHPTLRREAALFSPFLASRVTPRVHLRLPLKYKQTASQGSNTYNQAVAPHPTLLPYSSIALLIKSTPEGITQPGEMGDALTPAEIVTVLTPNIDLSEGARWAFLKTSCPSPRLGWCFRFGADTCLRTCALRSRRTLRTAQRASVWVSPADRQALTQHRTAGRGHS